MPASLPLPQRTAWLLATAAIVLGAVASCGEESSTAACPASVESYDNRITWVDENGILRSVRFDWVTDADAGREVYVRTELTDDAGAPTGAMVGIEPKIGEHADAGCLTYPVPPDFD